MSWQYEEFLSSPDRALREHGASGLPEIRKVIERLQEELDRLVREGFMKEVDLEARRAFGVRID